MTTSVLALLAVVFMYLGLREAGVKPLAVMLISTGILLSIGAVDAVVGRHRQELRKEIFADFQAFVRRWWRDMHKL